MFTQDQLISEEVVRSIQSLLGHHDHGHADHEHHDQKHSPSKMKFLTIGAGLLAIKKLGAMDPTLLNARERRIIQPVAPGIISSLIYASFLGGISLYSLYVLRVYGFKGFIGKPLLGYVGITAFFKGTLFGVNYLRQKLYSYERIKLVGKFTDIYGEEYLLKALEPNFRYIDY